MIRTTVTVSLAVLLFLGATRAEGETAKSGGGGGDGYSQQYHYASYPQHAGGGYAGLSIDLGTGVFLAVGAIIVLLALTAVLAPLSKGDGGWSRAGTAQTGTYRSLNVANLSEKVLNGIERIYETYNKIQ